jgi:class 3 adenylate cyclase
LMTIVLVGLIAVVITHARVRIEEQMHDALRTMVAWDAGMIELGLPDDAETLDFSSVVAGGGVFDFDADALLRFESLMDDMSANGLVDFIITDRDDVVLVGLDTRDIGTLAPKLETTDRAAVYSERTSPSPLAGGTEGGWLIHATAPIRNEDGPMVGSVRMTVDASQIQDLLNRLRNTLGAIGAAIVLVGAAIGWRLATPLVRTTRQLSAHAAGVARGEYLPYPQTPKPLSTRFSLRTKLTVALILILILMVGVLELVAIPIERRHVQDTLKDGIIAATEWIGQALSESFDPDTADMLPLPASEEDLQSLISNLQSLDLARMQELAEQMRSDDVAYTALVDEKGTVVLSDQLALIGEETIVPRETQIEETTWRGEEIWVASTPLLRGRDGERVGALQMAARLNRVETFLDESRNLFRLTGLIAVLAGVLLAQAIGGAVTAPVRQLAAGTRRVAQGDLSVQFDVNTKDELALLANAYNQMVAGLQEREWLRDMFGRFVSREVAEAIRTGQVRLEGENRVVSVLFCDIRGFTARSEQHTPEEMVALLNEYLPVVVEAAQAHEGTVNKFGGDSTLVIYGAPRPLQVSGRRTSAYQAVLTALEMRANLDRLNERLVERGEEPIRIGVGINTGTALAGAVGPPERQEYTVIGDTVNLASRIEGLNKDYPEHSILISGRTYEALGSHRDEFEFADLGKVEIRGKVEPVEVWAVLGVRRSGLVG